VSATLKTSNLGAATYADYTQGTGITTNCDGDTAASRNTNPGAWLNASATEVHAGKLATGVNATGEAMNNVVREARALSNGTTTDFYGNIALGPNLWPFIQLYDFTRYQTYDLVYERGGADEVIALSYDRPGGQGLAFDKEHYGLSHEVGVTLSNNELNLDPTDEDSWTFGTLPSNATTYYQLFDENGNADSSATNGAIKFTQGTQPFAFDSGVMKIDRNGPEFAQPTSTETPVYVLHLQDNGDQIAASSTAVSGANVGSAGGNHVTIANQMVTFTETGANTGVFTNWDDSLITNMFINPAANRGNQATFWWDDVEYSVLNMPFWGTIAFNTEGPALGTSAGNIGAEWNSGELVEIVLDDNDMNLDSRSQEQMTVASNTTIVPGIKIGSPITLASLETLKYHDDNGTTSFTDTIDTEINDNTCSSDYQTAGNVASYVSCYEKYSERAVVTNNLGVTHTLGDEDLLIFEYDGASVQTLKDLIGGANGSAAFSYINYDFRSLNGGSNSNNYYLNFTIGDEEASTAAASATVGSNVSPSRFNTGLVGSVLINSPSDKLTGFSSLDAADNLEVIVEINVLNSATLNDLTLGTAYPLTMDFVTFGQSDDGKDAGDRHNNSIYRLEVDEVDAAG
jgi:hypothetical protein